MDGKGDRATFRQSRGLVKSRSVLRVNDLQPWRNRPKLPFIMRLCILLPTFLIFALLPLAARQPNVLLILTDDQGYGDLACHGNPAIHTPALDALHAESVRLTNFHSSPTCAPTRAAIMTGKNPLRVGVWHTISGRSFLREGEKTLAEILATSGYQTGIFGKWHLGDNFPNRPQDRGFKETLVHGGGGVGQLPDTWGNDYSDDTYLHNGQPEAKKGYCTDVWFSAATAWIESVRHQPFFCCITTNAPHAPYLAPPDKLSRYENRADVPNPAFYAMIENIDDNVGRLMARLREFGVASDTIVIFMTDNGTAAGTDDQGRSGFNAGMRGKKGSPYEGGHRVPCFIRWTGGNIRGGRDVPQLTAHYDLMPTLAELTRAALPADMKLDGRSLAPLLRGDSAPAWPDRAVIVDSQRILSPVKWRQSAVLTEKWRLINGRELYDIQADPGQKQDLATQKPDILQDLTARYEAWWKELEPDFGRDAVIGLGYEAQNPALLTSHDWLCNEGTCAWDQSLVQAGRTGNGPWSVRLDRDGTYEFILRRWPFGLDRPLAEKFFPVEKARLHLGNWDQTQPVDPKAQEVRFRAPLKAGPARLQTWFYGPNGKSCGAYFVKVERIPDAVLEAEKAAAQPPKKKPSAK